VSDTAAIATIHKFYLQRLRDRHVQAGRPSWIATGRFLWSFRVRPAVREALRQLRSKRLRPSSVRAAIRSVSWAAALPGGSIANKKFGLENRWERRRDFFYHRESVHVLRDLADMVAQADHADLRNKIATVRRFASAGLPTAASLAEYKDGRVMFEPANQQNWRVDLITKPVFLSRGRGVELWEYRQGLHHSDGRSFSLDDLKKHLRELSVGQAMVVQARLKNHPVTAPISGRALSTVRLMTVRRPGEQPEVAESVFRMATGQAIADYFAVGGLAAPLDLETGRLGAATAKTSIDAPPVPRHPDSEVAIEGLFLPYWAKSKAIALAVHKEFSAMPAVGWDVALTDRGPVLLEGNGVWCVELVQMAHRRPLADMKLAGALAAHIRRI
jgi:hypothetical protein